MSQHSPSSDKQNRSDSHFMARAIQLAKQGEFTTGFNPNVACLLVKNERILGEAYHQYTGEAHAEVRAVEQALEAGYSLAGATAYVTLEPCSHHGRTPPCAQLLIEHKIARVVIASLDSNPLVSGQGVSMLKSAGISTEVGLMSEAAQSLNHDFFTLMEKQRPWIHIKIAMSLDAKIAMNSGESQWITSPSARLQVQYMRARATALLTSVNTIVADDPQMTARLDQTLTQPLLVVLDSQLKTPSDARIFTTHEKVMMVTLNDDVGAHRAYPDNVEFIIQTEPSSGGSINLQQCMADLAARGHHHVMVESGAQLASAFIEAKLCDRLSLFIAPKILGHQAKNAFLFPFERLSEHIALKIVTERRVGDDIMLQFEPHF